MNIEIISASAGSGKTYKLASTLEAAVLSGEARPDAILATTFTRKAAAELTERVRERLVRSGRLEEAARLGAARIGTVNSVCGRLVGDYAFDLGLSPRLAVIDETDAAGELALAMTGVATPAETRELGELGHRLYVGDWSGIAQEIASKARSNRIAPADLGAMGARSADELGALVGRPSGDAGKLDKELLRALQTFLASVDTTNDTTKVTAGAVREARRCRSLAQGPRGLPWRDWAKLARLSPAAKQRGLVADLNRIASGHPSHPKLHADVRRFIELVYEMAARAITAYQEHKRAHGLLDFVDQEALALDLLRRDDVRERLAGTIDLVLVDEFQDTSPIQLAIFLEFARVAPRNVWVGDQKQSIFGFRGTDPVLMDAAIDHVLGDDEPETLPKSWRSRPELVAVTSDLFAPAFEAMDIPASRVKLTAALEKEPRGLGPCAERWMLLTSNEDRDARAVARGVDELMADASVKVRDGQSGKARAIEPGDVAVLCRTNKQCRAVAGALTAAGLKAIIPTAGLMRTLEAQAALAGLRLWVDARDRLAYGQLARLFEHPDAPNEWLKEAVRKPGEAFTDLPGAVAVLAARAARALAGPVEALDGVIDALDLRAACAAWGDAEQRVANLDALRAHAVGYARGAGTSVGATPAGLITYLTGLDDGESDAQSLTPGGNAVTVSTWHSAKGLEWPVTVLFKYDKTYGNPALGITVVSESETIDMIDPLAGRWVRWWFSPYGDISKGVAFLDDLAADPVGLAAQERERKQNLRLLYVGWTRARDRVVLAGRKKTLAKGLMELLAINGEPALVEPDGKKVTWAGHDLAITLRELEDFEPEGQKPTPGVTYVAPGPRDHPPRFVSPSGLERVAKTGAPEKIGEPIRLRRVSSAEGRGDDTAARAAPPSTPDTRHSPLPFVDPESLGNAFHAMMAAGPCRPNDDLARDVIERWGLAGAIAPDQMVEAFERFEAWLEARWPGDKTVHREPPLMARRADGSVLRGFADMIVETADGFAVVDHKCHVGDLDACVAHAATFGGQLGAYAEVVAAATGKKHIGSFVHLPLSGVVVELR